jgi:glycosyltransferase involved in cell wall biosynthesis
LTLPAVLTSVAFSVPGWPPGEFVNGITSAVGRTRDALLERGVAVTVITGSVKSSAKDMLGVIDVSDSRIRRTEFFWHRVAARLARRDDIAVRFASAVLAGIARSRISHVQIIEMEETFGAARFVADRAAIPVVTRLHGPWFLVGAAQGVPNDATFRRRVSMEGMAFSRAAAISSPSRSALSRVINFYGLKTAVSGVIPNAQPVAPLAETWTLGGCERDTILFVGRFERVKGPDLAIDAFVELARRHPQVRLIFVGTTGSLATERGPISFSRYVEERVPVELRSRIEAYPFREQAFIASLRKRAFVTLVPSRFETFPMVVLEAIAQGCPIVASDAGGIPEVVGHGESALLFRSGDAASLARTVETLLGNSDLAARLGARAQRHCAEDFAPGVVAGRTLDFYNEVMARHVRVSSRLKTTAKRASPEES